MRTFNTIGSGVKYGFDQIYAGFESIDNGILWQFAKHGLLDSNPEEIAAFNSRFNHQWFTEAPKALVSGLEHVNPLAKIISIVCSLYKKTHSEKDLMNWGVRYAGRGIRALTRQAIVQGVLTVIVRKLLARESIRKIIQGGVGFASFGLATLAAEQGMQMKSYEAARDLRLLHPHLYSLLYAANVETFYFLVEKDLNELVRIAP